MTSYLAHAKTIHSTFEEFNITHVPRCKGKGNHADTLTKLTHSVVETDCQFISLVIPQWPTDWKDFPTKFNILDVSDTWMSPIQCYLKSDEFPPVKLAARRL